MPCASGSVGCSLCPDQDSTNLLATWFILLFNVGDLDLFDKVIVPDQIL